jgi:hypothetical protein
MPALSADEIDPGITWSRISPRMSLIYDVTGDGKNVIKLSAARYGSQGGFDNAYFINPLGWREIDLYWQDGYVGGVQGVADGRVTQNELYGWDGATVQDPTDSDYWIWSGGVNIDDPSSIVPTNAFDPNFNAPLLDELTISYERELMPDFAARFEFFYKKQHTRVWEKGLFADGTVDTAANYYADGTGPETSATYYGRTARPPYSYQTNYDKRHDRYIAGQIVLKKRLSNKWMLDASFTYMDWKRFHEGEYLGSLGLNNGAYYDAAVVAPQSGGSGQTGIFVNSRWQFKLSGLYQMPGGFNVAGVFRAREGYVTRAYENIYLTGIGTQSIYGPGAFGDLRLPSFWELDLRLEKVWNVTETSYVVFAVDAFNITNSAHILKTQHALTAPDYGDPLRILNPRVIRFGVRFTF